MNSRRSSQRRGATSVCAALLLAPLAAPGCGKRGDPLPPLRRAPQPVTALSVAQRGEQLELRFTVPRTYTDGTRLPVVEIEVLRADREGALAEVAQASVRPAAPGETLVESEPLPALGTSLRFAVRARVGKHASVLAAAPTLVVAPPPPRPTSLLARSGPRGVELAWTPPPPRPAPSPSPSPAATPAASASPAPPAAPPASAPASPPPAATPSAAPSAAAAGSPAAPAPAPGASPVPGASLVPAATPPPEPPPWSFRVYRRAKDGAYNLPLIAASTLDASFEDSTAVPGQSLCYVVRTVAALDPLVESAPSEEACLEFRDVTPPATPTGAAAFLADDGAVELSWSPSSESDLVGYRVYRRQGSAEPERLADLPAGETRWRDAQPPVGERRTYTLTAVDQAGNESTPTAEIVVAGGP